MINKVIKKIKPKAARIIPLSPFYKTQFSTRITCHNLLRTSSIQIFKHSTICTPFTAVRRITLIALNYMVGQYKTP